MYKTDEGSAPIYTLEYMCVCMSFMWSCLFELTTDKPRGEVEIVAEAARGFCFPGSCCSQVEQAEPGPEKIWRVVHPPMVDGQRPLDEETCRLRFHVCSTDATKRYLRPPSFVHN